MIKFVMTTKNAGPILGLGLSELNIKRLRDGDPILFQLEDLGGDWMLVRRSEVAGAPIHGGQVLVMVAENERELAKRIGFDINQPRPGQETRIVFDHHTKRPGQ